MKAKQSFGPDYDCKQAWPEDCFCQCGDSGIVFGGKGSLNDVLTSEDPLQEVASQAQDPKSYITAFFEAFPKPPTATFIRGEGKTVEEAELNAFIQYQKFAACDHSMGYERRDYKNGVGFCLGCGMFKSKAFEPLTTCVECKTPTYYSSDNKGNWYCEEHVHLMPEENKDSMHKMMDRWRKKKEDLLKQKQNESNNNSM